MTEAEWLISSDSLEMLSLAEDTGRISDRKVRLFATAACRRIWDRIDDVRSRLAVEVAERRNPPRPSVLTTARWDRCEKPC